jgi:hypothetical protein
MHTAPTKIIHNQGREEAHEHQTLLYTRFFLFGPEPESGQLRGEREDWASPRNLGLTIRGVYNPAPYP